MARSWCGKIRLCEALCESLECLVEETVSLLGHFPQSHMRKLLSVDSAHLRDLRDVLGSRHRVAGSLNFLGSILKVVAGTPDSSDIEKSRVLEARLIDANNRQIEINTKIQSRINKLTATVNLILKTAKESQIDTSHLYETQVVSTNQ